MTEKQFDDFLEKSILKFGEEYIDFSAEWNEPHDFSRKYLKKKSRLIKRQKSFYFPIVKTPLRRSAAITIATVIAVSVMTMSVSALRNAFLNFIMKIFDTHTTVTAVLNDEALTEFEDIYAVTYIPDGFELVKEYNSSDNIPWLTTTYKRGEDYIIFTQYLKSTYNVDVNTEGYCLQPIEINGNEGFIVDMKSACYISWENSNYILELAGIVDKDTLIEVANSVQKVE